MRKQKIDAEEYKFLAKTARKEMTFYGGLLILPFLTAAIWSLISDLSAYAFIVLGVLIWIDFILNQPKNDIESTKKMAWSNKDYIKFREDRSKELI